MRILKFIFCVVLFLTFFLFIVSGLEKSTEYNCLRLQRQKEDIGELWYATARQQKACIYYDIDLIN